MHDDARALKEPSSYFFGLKDRLELIAEGLQAIRKAQESLDGKSSPLTFLLQDYAETVKEAAESLERVVKKLDDEWTAKKIP